MRSKQRIAHTVGRPGRDPAVVYAREKCNCSEVFYMLLAGWGYFATSFDTFRAFHNWRWNVYSREHPPPTYGELKTARTAKIAFLRNPIDRAVSMFKHYKRHFPTWRVTDEKTAYASIESFFGALERHWGAVGVTAYGGSRVDAHWSTQTFEGFDEIGWTVVIPVEKMHEARYVEQLKRLTGVEFDGSFHSNHWAATRPTDAERATARPFVERLYAADLRAYNAITTASSSCALPQTSPIPRCTR